jgi:hypothetical protein
MRTLTTLFVASVLNGCTSWHTQLLSPQQVIDTKQPDRVRVTLPDGARIVLRGPRVAADSLVGLADHHPMAVPIGNIARVETRQFSAGKTIALTLAIPGAIVAVIAIDCAIEGCTFGVL